MSGDSSSGGLPAWQKAFLDQHRLGVAYLRDAQQWFVPLAAALAAHPNGALPAAAGTRSPTRSPDGGPLVVGVNGSQGSGKSTLCAYLCALLQARYGLRAVTLSLDDYYLTREQRGDLASSVNALLATRGVPGTHDIGLLHDTLDALQAADDRDRVAIPRFDKARDDRRPASHWDVVQGKPDLVLLEGWCLGARPQPAARLQPPVNQLEREEDPDATWREYANNALQREFLPLYRRIHRWVMLQAPSFDVIYRWRLEQEHKLAAATAGPKDGVMSDLQVARFIQHFQRLTEHTLATLPPVVDYLYVLDERRGITLSRPDWRLVR